MRPEYWASLAAGILAISAILWATGPYGPGLTHDSAHYLAAARNLAAGRGMRGFDDAPYSGYAPLFPLLLALPGTMGLDPAQTARFLNAFAFGATVFLFGLLLAAETRFRPLAVIGSLAALTSLPLLKTSATAWSEPLFTLLVLGLVASLVRWLRTARLNWFVLACLCGAAGVLQRYAGVFIVGAAAIALLVLSRLRFGRRLLFALLLAAASALPLLFWILYRHLQGVNALGRHSAPYLNFLTALQTAAETILVWFLPRSFLPASRWVLLVGLLALGLALAFLLLQRWKNLCLAAQQPQQPQNQSALPLFQVTGYIVTCVYVLALCLLSIRVGVSSFDRMLAPVVPLTLAPALGIFAPLGESLGRRMRKPWLGVALVSVLLSLWLVYPARKAALSIIRWHESGAGVYDGDIVRNYNTVQWLKLNPLTGTVYSNDPALVYSVTGRPCRMSPAKDKPLWQAGVQPGDYLVWFVYLHRPYLYSVAELGQHFELEEIAFLEDGGILIFR